MFVGFLGNPFPLAEKDIEFLLNRLSNRMPFIDPGATLGTINSLYWFAEFLEDSLSLPSDQAQNAREACIQFFKKVYPSLENESVSVGIWTQFPRELELNSGKKP